MEFHRFIFHFIVDDVVVVPAIDAEEKAQQQKLISTEMIAIFEIWIHKTI